MQHSIFQAQISDYANNHTCRRTHSRRRQSHQCHCRYCTTTKHDHGCHRSAHQHLQITSQKAKDATTAQRVLKERAQAQRVLTEDNHQEDIEVPTTKPISNPTAHRLVEDTPFPPLEVEYPNINVGILPTPPSSHRMTTWTHQHQRQTLIANVKPGQSHRTTSST